MGWHRGLEESSEGFEFGEVIASLDFARQSTRIVILTGHVCPKLPNLQPKIDGEVCSRWRSGILSGFIDY